MSESGEVIYLLARNAELEAQLKEEQDHHDRVQRISAGELQALREAFSHTHVNNGENDNCKECGLDLRNMIHARVLEKSDE